MKVLVTGAGGFIGRHFITVLRARGHECVAVSRIVDVVAGSVGVGDFELYDGWQQLMAGVEVVIHLAARVHVMSQGAEDHDALYQSTNVDLTLRLAKEAAAAGVKRFIFLSSIKVNGEKTLDGKRFSEVDLPAPEDGYGCSKLAAEKGLQELCMHSAMELVIIRPPLVYGAGVKANFQHLLEVSRRAIPFPFGRVKNRRDMVSVDNLCDLIVTCLDHPAAANQIFLVSDGCPYSLSGLLSTMAEVQGRKIWLWPFPVSILSVMLWLLGKQPLSQPLLGDLEVDMTHTTEALGWAPKSTLEETLKKMVG